MCIAVVSRGTCCRSVCAELPVYCRQLTAQAGRWLHMPCISADMNPSTIASLPPQAAARALVVAKEKAANEAKSEFMSLMCHEVRDALVMLPGVLWRPAAWCTTLRHAGWAHVLAPRTGFSGKPAIVCLHSSLLTQLGQHSQPTNTAASGCCRSCRCARR